MFSPIRALLRLIALLTLGIVALIPGAPVVTGSLCDSPGDQAGTEIFKGVTYGCERLKSTDEGSGFLHWTRIDLTAPGIELSVTSLDPEAVSNGWQYRLRRVTDVLDEQDLAVAINASLFTRSANWRPALSGDFAKGVETVVANHVVSHVWEHTYLLWFDDELTPHLRGSKPPTPTELISAKWGVGGQGVWLWDGQVWSGSDRNPDARTAIAINQRRRLLFLAVGSHVSPRLMLQTLADLGAMDGMMLDGGNSTSMAIGKGAKGVSEGSVYGSWRPVATHFGVRAKNLDKADKPTRTKLP